MLIKDKDNMVEFALLFQRLKPVYENNLELFSKFLDDYLQTVKPHQNQIENLTIISQRFQNIFEKYKESGLDALKPVVGLVEGVFDMLHFGHFNAIRQASLCCDKLIVGINCDETVVKHKGLDNKSYCL